MQKKLFILCIALYSITNMYASHSYMKYKPLHSANTEKRIQHHVDYKLRKSAYFGDEEYLNKLLERDGACVNTKDEEKKTPLHLAAEEGNIKCVKVLLQHKAALNELDHKDFTPLMYAMVKQHHDIVTLLILKGAIIQSNKLFKQQITANANYNLSQQDLADTSDEDDDEDVIYFLRASTSSSDEESC